jgi:hypothetical protein
VCVCVPRWNVCSCWTAESCLARGNGSYVPRLAFRSAIEQIRNSDLIPCIRSAVGNGYKLSKILSVFSTSYKFRYFDASNQSIYCDLQNNGNIQRFSTAFSTILLLNPVRACFNYFASRSDNSRSLCVLLVLRATITHSISIAKMVEKTPDHTARSGARCVQCPRHFPSSFSSSCAQMPRCGPLILNLNLA